MPKKTKLTVIIPAFNEEQGLAAVLDDLLIAARRNYWQILVVDDGSKDNTAEVVAQFPEVKLISHSINMGYGAAIKTGTLAVETEWIATFDADGQHRSSDLEHLDSMAKDCDALIGVRQPGSHSPLSRIPRRFVLRHTANLIMGQKVPDINCGLRIIRRTSLLNIMGLTSDKFSFSTSTLLALLKTKHDVRYVPVTLDKRVGKSSVRQVRDGMRTLLLVLRLLVLFDPIRVFLPLSLSLFFFSFVYQLYELAVYGLNIPTFTLLLFVSGLVVFSFALLADQVSAMRRELSMFEKGHPQLSVKACSSDDVRQNGEHEASSSTPQS